ncbi:hypothetical protein MNBD_GAMMA18-413 [hydrothermal vent metagenome]|uniref:Uncharacterized protein n=1 Tax=hydrothermal vent metagenome TaxID=652676 RepID=A0A3B0YZU1_9ZZZZ
MKIRLLTEDAYNRIIKLKETMAKKDRGYGVLPVEINGITFAIPFRSNMNHKNGFKTVFHNGAWNGLDYTKAIIIDKKDLKNEAFKLRRNDEYLKVKNNKNKIQKQFEKYVSNYVALVSKKEKIRVSRFGFTTLQNYHAELGISRSN